MTIETFLEPADLIKLTGRQWKSKQIAWLRSEAIPFRVSATGHPVVTWSAVNGKKEPPPQTARWQPKALERI